MMFRLKPVNVNMGSHFVPADLSGRHNRSAIKYSSDQYRFWNTQALAKIANY